MRNTLALALALLLGGCATSREGKGCEYDEDCGPALVCKGGKCGPLRSLSGGKCVTEAGCALGLQCVDGTCTAGMADSDACAEACQHVARLMVQEADAKAPPPEAGQARGLGAMSLEAMTFEAECHQACVDKMSRARTDCMTKLTALKFLELCP